MTEDSRAWLITLGLLMQDLDPSPTILDIVRQGTTRYSRKYKVFEVDANDGTVKSMKIRKV